MREELVEKLQEKLNVSDLKDAKPAELKEALENQLGEIKDNYNSMFDSMQILTADMYDTEDELLKLNIANPELCQPTNRPPLTEADFVIDDNDDKVSNAAKQNSFMIGKTTAREKMRENITKSITELSNKSTKTEFDIVNRLKKEDSAFVDKAKSVGFTSDMLK